MSHHPYIVIDPAVRFGRPCIKGTRISVYDILNWFAHGMTREDVLSDYRELKVEHLDAAFAYAANREEGTRVA